MQKGSTIDLGLPPQLAPPLAALVVLSAFVSESLCRLHGHESTDVAPNRNADSRVQAEPTSTGSVLRQAKKTQLARPLV